MIVRRITAGAAGLALVGTAFAVAPATAAGQGETQIALNGGLVQNLTADGVKLSVVKPAKVKKGVVTLPVSNRNGVKIEHSGGIKFTGKDAQGNATFVTMSEPTINFKTGNMDASVIASNIPAPGVLILKLAKLTGGTKKAKKGLWKNANLKLSKTIDLDGTGPGKPADPAGLLNALLNTTAFKSQQKIGKVTITLK